VHLLSQALIAVAVVLMATMLGATLFLSLKPIWRPASSPVLRQNAMRAALACGGAGILLLSLSRWLGA
jgi:ABC-type glucose/galactose transport system permease subunit